MSETFNDVASRNVRILPDVVSPAKSIQDLGRDVSRAGQSTERANSEAELINLLQYAVVTGLTNAGGNASMAQIKSAAKKEVVALQLAKTLNESESSELGDQISAMSRLGLENYLVGYADQIIYGVSVAILKTDKKMVPSRLLARTKLRVKREADQLFPNEKVREKAEQRLSDQSPMDLFEMSVQAMDQSLAGGDGAKCTVEVGLLMSYVFKKTPELFENFENISLDDNLVTLRRALLALLDDAANVIEVKYSGAITEAILMATASDFSDIWQRRVLDVLTDLFLFYSSHFKSEPKLLWLAVKEALYEEKRAGNISIAELTTARRVLLAVPPRDFFARAGILGHYNMYLRPDGYIKVVTKSWMDATIIAFIGSHSRVKASDQSGGRDAERCSRPEWGRIVRLYRLFERCSFRTTLPQMRSDFVQSIYADSVLDSSEKRRLLEMIEAKNERDLLQIVRALRAFQSPRSFVRETISIIKSYLGPDADLGAIRQELLTVMDVFEQGDFYVSNILPGKLRDALENLSAEQLAEMERSSAIDALHQTIGSLDDKTLSGSHALERILEIMGAPDLDAIWSADVQSLIQSMISDGQAQDSGDFPEALLFPPVEDEDVLLPFGSAGAHLGNSKYSGVGFSMIEAAVIKQLLSSRSTLLQHHHEAYSETAKITGHLNAEDREKFLRLRRAYQVEAVRQFDVLHERLLPGYVVALERMQRIRELNTEKPTQKMVYDSGVNK